MFVAFSSLFLFHVFPHFSSCGVIANPALQTLQQRGFGTLHFAGGDRFRRPPAGCSCVFKTQKRIGGKVQQPVTLMGRCMTGPGQLLLLSYPISFPLSQETSKDVWGRKGTYSDAPLVSKNQTVFSKGSSFDSCFCWISAYICLFAAQNFWLIVMV